MSYAAALIFAAQAAAAAQGPPPPQGRWGEARASVRILEPAVIDLADALASAKTRPNARVRAAADGESWIDFS